MDKSLLTLSSQQIIWLKDLVTADISDWQDMAARPIDEVGAKMHHLANVHIDSMRSVLANLQAVESVKTLCKLKENGLNPEIVLRVDDILVVVLCD
jgi:hypothetical protein